MNARRLLPPPDADRSVVEWARTQPWWNQAVGIVKLGCDQQEERCICLEILEIVAVLLVLA